MSEKELIENCINKDRKSQNFLYKKYAPTLFGVCRRYCSQNADAEDVLIKAFSKIFGNLTAFEFKGSFEGWMKKITVNEALMHLRSKKVKFDDVLTENSAITKANVISKIMEDDLMNVLNRLPDGYRTIFNLFAIEGYKHKEIAEKLDISINTSKSQLIKARKKLAQFLEEIEVI